MRTLALWHPDWPVRALAQTRGIADHAPVAIVDRGMIFACSEAARAHGIRIGMKPRDAQSRCTALIVAARDDELSLRMFEPIIAAVEDLTPRVHVVQPGVLAVSIKGLAAYTGNEINAAATVSERVVSAGGIPCRFGIADGPYAAELAAHRAPPQECIIVPPDGSASFLAPLPISEISAVLGDQVQVLSELGLTTIGDFAALTPAAVLSRFGTVGAHAHRLARGEDVPGLRSRTPPAELVRSIDFEPPLALVDPIAFSVRRIAQEFVDSVLAESVVCTSVLISCRSESGELSEQAWLHPQWFDAAAIVDRVRWQLGGTDALSTPVNQVRFEAVEVAAQHVHAEGLWGSGPDVRVQHVLSRIQGLLGPESVLRTLPAGGRELADRHHDVCWGEPVLQPRSTDLPWPGRLPDPAPATVYRTPRPVTVCGRQGEPVGANDRGFLTGVPTAVTIDNAVPQPITEWAGPWPVEERWWDHARNVSIMRIQVVLGDGSAWLLALREDTWFVQAAYD